jgi:hypothetical protein
MTTLDLHFMQDLKKESLTGPLKDGHLSAHSFEVPAIGKQVESQRKSLPVVSISKVSRQAREKVFISKAASVVTALGRHSTVFGPKYDLPSTMDVKEGRGAGFTKGCSTDFLNIRPEDGISTNDELEILVDSQQFKYPRDATHVIGTDPRGKLKDAELIKNHAAAFVGRNSPGPVYGGSGGPNYKCTKPTQAQAVRFGQKLPSKWQEISDTPVQVGPGIYRRKDDSIGRQHLSQRKNQPVNEFPHGPKFEKTRSADAVSQLDAAKSSVGKQSLSINKSEPSVGFGRGTRNQRSRTAICITSADMGPKAHMPKLHMSMPRLPMESEIMKAGYF